ncbi:hypothetical protein TRVL_07461 [Trypanosoma vivax]|nr:hypothetical protein TRVL_07461 [Trypanosoma vivax]
MAHTEQEGIRHGFTSGRVVSRCTHPLPAMNKATVTSNTHRAEGQAYIPRRSASTELGRSEMEVLLYIQLNPKSNKCRHQRTRSVKEFAAIAVHNATHCEHG